VNVAIISSAHGFGHVTRDLVLADALEAMGARVTCFHAAPPSVLGGRPAVAWTVDVGIAQHDSLTEDLPATLARLAEVVTDARIDALAQRLSAFDRVVVDIAPPALEAARRAQVPAHAFGNFDWAWIYAHYPELGGWARRFAAWQAPHPALAMQPGPGLFGFASVEDIGLVGRRAAGEGRLVAEGRAVLVGFGGLGLADVEGLLPRIPGVTWICAPPMPRIVRADIRFVADVPFPALVAGVDAVFTKPGYGIFAEAALAGTPVVWLDRGQFPEAPSLEAALLARGDVKVQSRAGVADALRERWARPAPPPAVGGGEHRAAAVILRAGEAGG
jgi:hypothetical protein